MLDLTGNPEHLADDTLRAWLDERGVAAAARRVVVHPVAGVITVWVGDDTEDLPFDPATMPDGMHERFGEQGAYLIGDDVDTDERTT